MLTWCSSDPPQLTYTIRPWVKTGLSFHGLPSPVLADPSSKEKAIPTIRRVISPASLDSDSPHTSKPASAPTTQDTSTPTPSARPQESAFPSFSCSSSQQATPERRTPRAVLFGPRDKNHSSPQTPSTGRPRGKTVPLVGSSPKTPEHVGARTDSAMSWTPSTSSRHLTSWFSGLLGR